MTYEQALAINQNLTPEQVRNDLERYLLRGEAPIVKGVAMAMQALEKQIPKKVVENSEIEKINNHNNYKCPKCCVQVYRTMHRYHCGQCGQKLDWSDTNG